MAMVLLRPRYTKHFFEKYLKEKEAANVCDRDRRAIFIIKCRLFGLRCVSVHLYVHYCSASRWTSCAVQAMAIDSILHTTLYSQSALMG